MIKVCGMRDAENIRDVESLGIDLMGFIFWPRSSRYVAERPAYLPTHCKRVGVFVDETIETVCRLAADYALDYIRTLNAQCSVIKAFNIATAADLAQTAPYVGLVDYFLFDTKGPSVGGNGEKFDWSILSAYDGSTPFLLSGGIGPDDAESLSSYLSVLDSRHCIGIDLNSRFERSPGLKDVATLRRFLTQLTHSSYQTH